jgi:hypothetical protein
LEKVILRRQPKHPTTAVRSTLHWILGFAHIVLVSRENDKEYTYENTNDANAAETHS